MNRIAIWVDGIRNDTEKIQMKKNLEKIDGINEVSIDRAQSLIAIDYNNPATEKEIKEHILSTGHDISREEEW
jgi:copper chaperone CopZ